jgi:hypothetical protein
VTADRFNKTLDEFASKQAPEAVTKALRATCLRGLGRLVDRTPVDTGRARGGWQVEVGTKPDTPTGQIDPAGEATKARGGIAIARSEAGDVVFITNVVEYIEYLEHGHSQQAPNGMLEVTVNELERMFK